MVIKSLFAKIDEFIRYQHMAQCKHLLGNEFERIHRKMDRSGGFYHRQRGHSKEFIMSEFTERERRAAFIHLLGDCVLDRLYNAFEPVLTKIDNGEIEPPYFSRGHGTSKWLWNIDETAINKMMKRWGEIYVETLKHNL